MISRDGKIKVSVDVSLTAAQTAAVFAEMDDEWQAQFFIEVAKIAATWEPGTCRQVGIWSVATCGRASAQTTTPERWCEIWPRG